MSTPQSPSTAERAYLIWDRGACRGIFCRIMGLPSTGPVRVAGRVTPE